jgi:hypothetical protein
MTDEFVSEFKELIIKVECIIQHWEKHKTNIYFTVGTSKKFM